jgi:abequosyltransferase
MEKINKLLTIAIPTYNRKNFINNQIINISRQIKLNNLQESIELVVIDNNSQDGTYNYINQKYPGIKIIKNNENIGLLGNYLKCFFVSTSEYTWVVGDDDNLGSNLILDVVNSLQKKNIGLLHLNHKCVDKYDGPVLIDKFYKLSSNSYGNNELVNQLLQDTHTGGFMFITANVVKTKLAKKVIENANHFCSYLSFPIYVNMRCAFEEGIYYLATNELNCVYNQSSWYAKKNLIMAVEIPDILFALNKLGLNERNLKYCIENDSFLLHPQYKRLFKDFLAKRLSFYELVFQIRKLIINRIKFRVLQIK